MTEQKVPIQAVPFLPVSARNPKPLPLVSEQSDFLQGEETAAGKVQAFLSKALAAAGQGAAEALVPWMCDVLLSKNSLKAYGRDLVDFVRHMATLGLSPLQV